MTNTLAICRRRSGCLATALLLLPLPPSEGESASTTVFVAGGVVAAALLLCVACAARCFRRCGETQRQALRDQESESLGSWQARMRSLTSRHNGGRFGFSLHQPQPVYSRLPATDSRVFAESRI